MKIRRVEMADLEYVINSCVESFSYLFDNQAFSKKSLAEIKELVACGMGYVAIIDNSLVGCILFQECNENIKFWEQTKKALNTAIHWAVVLKDDGEERIRFFDHYKKLNYYEPKVWLCENRYTGKIWLCDDNDILLENLVVNKFFRGKGIGTALTSVVLRYAKEKEKRYAFVYALLTSYSIFKKNGFTTLVQKNCGHSVEAIDYFMLKDFTK